MKHEVIDIYFNDRDGNDDKTQFDFHGDWNDVMEAWKGFCDENGLEFGSICGLDVYEVDEPGLRCPKCGASTKPDVTSLDGWDDELANGLVFVDVTCPACHAEYTNVYRFDCSETTYEETPAPHRGGEK